MPKVYNKRNKDYPKDAVYVGRPSRWGNPFRVGKEGSNREVCELYANYIRTAPEQVRADIRQHLKGKDLVCWCSPKPCHADVLLEIANE